MSRGDPRYEKTAPRTNVVQGAFAFLGEDGGKEVRPFSLELLDGATLLEAVQGWCGQGYAITLGLTSDRGALGIHLMADGSIRKSYFPTADEANYFLERLRPHSGAR